MKVFLKFNLLDAEFIDTKINLFKHTLRIKIQGKILRNVGIKKENIETCTQNPRITVRNIG